MRDSSCIIVFAKAPEPGRVKTRLMPALGAAGAARLHRMLVSRALTEACESGLGPVELWCAPDAKHSFFAECARCFRVTLHAQGGENLGERMERAFRRNLERYSRVLLLGSDIPALDASYLRRAHDALGKADAVIGPAEDGGYVLIGLKRPAPEIFRDMGWGGPDVMERTRQKLALLGWVWRELEPLWDVDRPEDLSRLAR